MSGKEFNQVENYDDPALNAQELQFDIAGLESYYERRVLGIGSQALSGIVEIGTGE